MTEEKNTFKIKEMSGQSAWQTYRQLCFGDVALMRAFKTEAITFLFGSTPGAIGLGVRKMLYPGLFGQTGRKNIFGRNLTLRHPHKIQLGRKAILDDGVVLDAKGKTNSGISIGDNVYIGRNTIIYTKNGNIRIGNNVNISSNCQIFSSGDLEIGDGTMIAAFCYLLNGGNYDTAKDAPLFTKQSGNISKGPTSIGTNCWLAAHSTITDGVSLGDHCVVGAGSVVLKNIPDNTLCVGTPARAIRTL